MYLYELVEVVVSGVDSVDKYDLTDEKTCFWLGIDTCTSCAERCVEATVLHVFESL
jgi:hypothetical protein